MPDFEARIGAPCWVELYTSDPDRAAAFYGPLFGWEAETPNPEFGGYRNFTKDGVRIAGCMINDGTSGTPDVWSVYLEVEDTAATVGKATERGAQIIVPAMPVGDFGTMAVIIDPTGAAVGVWQPDTHPGFGRVAEPGAPAWFELHTRSYDDAVKFYADVFGWDTHVVSDTDDFRYTTFGADDEARAGIMDAAAHLAEGEPSHWQVYFAVEDADAALGQITALGGSVVQPPEDTPYGRLATAADPTGTRFKIAAS